MFPQKNISHITIRQCQSTFNLSSTLLSYIQVSFKLAFNLIDFAIKDILVLLL